MIQVYKKNELFIIENTVTDIIYPNLTREEALVLLKKFDRDEPEDRCDFAIKEDNISFEYASLDDKDKTVVDLEAKLKALQNGIIDDETLNMLVKEHKLYKDLEAKLAESEKSKESYRLQNEQHHLQLLQFYSRLGVEAFGADIHEKALETLMIMKEQLAEKDKEIESLKHFKVTIGTMETNQVDISSTTYIDQDKISFCIEQLEKVKKFTEKEIKECNKLLQEEFEDDYYIQSVNARQSMCYEFKREIDNQIKQLKEKNNG